MSLFRRLIAPALLASAAICSPAMAGHIVIDFEHLPGLDGKLGTADDVPMNLPSITPIGSAFDAMGMHFEQGTLFQGAFFDGNPDNHFISSTNPIVDLAFPVYGISIDSHSFWDVNLTAYDAAGNIVGYSRMNGGQGTISVSSTTAIARFSVLPDQSQSILNLDNLVLTDALQADVPEPASPALFLAGMLGLGAILRRRNRA